MEPSISRANSNLMSGSEDDEADYIEIPSFLESLASSAGQLQQLAHKTTRFYIRGLISYGYIHEVKWNPHAGEQAAPARVAAKGKSNRGPNQESVRLVQSRAALESMSSLVDFLPFLEDLACHLEKCFTTLEITFRRFNYHLNKSLLASSSNTSARQLAKSEFRPPPESRFDPVFIATMDVLFAIISLDETIESHTSIRQSIGLLEQACRMAAGKQATSGVDFEMKDQQEAGKLERLLELLANIRLTLGNDSRTIFQQCLEHLQHLDLIFQTKGKPANSIVRNVSEHLDEFIVFYAENIICPPTQQTNLKASPLSSQELTISLLQLNLAPTTFMTTLEAKVLGLTSLFVLNNWIFKKSLKRPTRAFNQLLCKLNRINLINLAETNCFICLADFLTKYLPKSRLPSGGCLEGKTLSHLRGQDNGQFLPLNLKSFSNKITIEVMSWQVNLRAANRKHDGLTSLEELDDHDQMLIQRLQQRRVLLERGLSLAEEINSTVRSTIAVHLKLQLAMSRQNLVLLLKCVALLKSIQLAMQQDRASIVGQQLVQDQLVRTRWRKLVSSARKRSITSRYSDQRLDQSTSLILFDLCSNLIGQLHTNCGPSLLCMAVSMLTVCLNAQELNDLNVLLSLFQPVDVYSRLEDCSNCSYLYWNVPTFGAYYTSVFEEDPGNIGEINYFHRAVNDIQQLFQFERVEAPTPTGESHQPEVGWLCKKRDQFIERLADELWDQFRTHTLDKICQELEIELRLQIHRDLHLNGHNPFKRHLYNFKRIFLAPSDRLQFSLLGRCLSLRQHVEQQLSEIFYNLTSIAPHDWFSYDCMINMAREKYGLQLINSQMPTQTLDCGVDLMEITRNLALFLSRYSYDISNQLFVEKCSSQRLSSSSAASVMSGPSITNTHSMLNSNSMALNQTLNVIQIRHVSMSIQTHGFGLLNSAINCTYQAIKRLINLISRQLSDDQLRALLTKQQQQLQSCLVGSGISFERALRLARKFKLQMSQQDSSFQGSAGAPRPAGAGGRELADLDQVRQLITQLGNALAFVRLLKSGALNCASRSVDFLPDLEDTTVLRLTKFVKAEFCRHPSKNCCADSLIEAAGNFDACLEDFAKNFSPKTDYFALIVSLFSEALNSEGAGGKKQPETANNGSSQLDDAAGGEAQQASAEASTDKSNGAKHKLGDRFKLFYLLVPSMTINFIDFIINAKERVVSRSSASRVGALICDDGFPMGVAFLLIVLGQTTDFAKLEWFKEVRTKLEADEAEVQRRVGGSNYEESLRQTSSMTLRRLQRLRQEYDTLNYNLKSALLLFRCSSANVTER